MNELLSISIPTRNRASYLQELLQSIKENTGINKHTLKSNLVKIYVFDNDSTDDTSEIVKASGLDIIYKKNTQNIGGDPNIYQAYTSVKGKYVWVMGDDELIPKNAITYILQLINTHHPHLILTKSKGYKTFVKLPLSFPSYHDFAIFAQKNNPHLLIAHSLTSANIILKSCFDADFAFQQIHTHYGHFYGMIKGLKRSPGKILISKKETLIVRDRRADCVDGIWPENIEEDQACYLEWLSKEYDLKNLVARRVVPDYRQKLFLEQQKLSPIKMVATLYHYTYSFSPFSRPVLRIIKSLYMRLHK